MSLLAFLPITLSPCSPTKARSSASRAVTSRRLVRAVAGDTAPHAAPSLSKPSTDSIQPPASRTLQPRDERYPSPPTTEPFLTAQARVARWANIPSMWQDLAEAYGDAPALVDERNQASDTRVEMSFAKVAEDVGTFAAGLRRLGLKSGEMVAQFAENGTKWMVADQGLLSIGAVNAVRGASAPESELQYIYEHSGSIGMITDNEKVLRKLLPGLKPGSIRFAIVLQGDAPDDVDVDVHTFDDVMQKGREADKAKRSATAQQDDLATLLYTSGTTGKPKAVPLTHRNILYNLEFIGTGTVEPRFGDTCVSILPIWHVFERTGEYYLLSRGTTLVYSSVRRFKDDLQKHKPQVLIAVPRVLESLHHAVVQKVASAPPARKALFALFTALSLWFVRARRLLQGISLRQKEAGIPKKMLAALLFCVLSPLHAIATKLMWSKIKAGLGGRIRIAIVAGGATPMFLEDFFETLGVEVTVGYGLTETSPTLANRFAGHNVRGSVGLPLPGTEIKIVDPDTRTPVPAGEIGVITARGPGVASGYFMNDDATRESFVEGFFNTGDLGRLLPQGDLEITGRRKDMIVLSNGENISPQALEDALLESEVVDQIVLVGQDERHLGALVVPKLDRLHELGFVDQSFAEEVDQAADNRKSLQKLEDRLRSNESLDAYITREFRSRLRSRSDYVPYHQVGSYRYLLEPFTVENGRMTQTLKIKKNVVADEFAEEIRAMFSTK